MAVPVTDRGGVLIVLLAKRYGGADVRAQAIATALQDRRRCVVAVLARSPLHDRLAAAGLVVLALPYRRADPRIAWSLFRAIRKDGYRVVDAHNPQSHLWGALAGFLARTPIRLCTVHSISADSDRGRLRIALYESTLRVASLLGCRYIAISDSIRAYLESLGIPGRRISMIPNGIDTPMPSGTVARIRDTIGWGPAAYVVIAVGRLEPVKGHRYLLQALAMLSAEFSQLRCLIVGEGRERDALEAEAARLGLSRIVHFAGFRNDVADLLIESDLFCLPSLSEGIPYAVLEAGALGLPLLASAVGGVTEILTHGDTARLVPPADATALARELRWFLEHRAPAAALGQSARALVRARFGPTAMIAGTLAAYDGAIAGG